MLTDLRGIVWASDTQMTSTGGARAEAESGEAGRLKNMAKELLVLCTVLGFEGG